jgi:hypothetical protein
LASQLGYDFVLIADSEGLRSPELSSKATLSRDNEFATFMIGIAHLTLINIMGENPSEMQEVLQICMQALLRFKQVEIKRSCMFVHQNVADSSAGDKNMDGKQRLLDRLDDMVKIAAKEENLDGYTCFSDIISFDIDNQVFYFKNLLEGDPPMAPPNPSYSDDVQRLKTKLLNIQQWQKDCKFPTFSKFKLQVRDFWTALLKENFVFSFRNTLEMKVYNDLEEKYSAWSWKQHLLHNQIESKGESEEEISRLHEGWEQTYCPILVKMKAYFKQDQIAEIVSKWKVSTEKRLEILKFELIDETRKEIGQFLQARNSRVSI